MENKDVVKLDDVFIVVQALTTAIKKKAFSKEEISQFVASWERLADVMNHLQRKNLLKTLYPSETVNEDPKNVEGQSE